MELLLTFGFPFVLFLAGLYLISWFRDWEKISQGSVGAKLDDARVRPEDGNRRGPGNVVAQRRLPGRPPVEEDEEVRREVEELRRSLKGG